MMRGLFYRRRYWLFGNCLAAVTALLLMLFSHGLVTTVSTYPSVDVLRQIASPEVFTMLAESAYWNAQSYFISAPFAAGQFWWHPVSFTLIAILFVLLWFMGGLMGLRRGLILWAVILLSVLSLVFLPSIFPLTQDPTSAAFAPAVALYLAAAAFILSLGYWRSE
ncbi:MAG: hypothetical protein JJU10_00740 [Idiomarina sp.]|nr:hypothetical protein [Idiomarina sp.]